MSQNIINPEHIQLPLPPQEEGMSISELKQIIFRRWKPALAVGATVFAGIFIPTILQRPLYKSESLILLENPKTQDSAPVLPSQASVVSNFASIKNLSTEILVLRSKTLVHKAIQQYPKVFEDLSAQDIIEALTINQAAVNDIPTDVLSVTYLNHDAQRAREILQTLGEVYVEYSLDKQRSQAGNAIKFIDEQLPVAQLELDKVAFELRSFRQANNLVDPNIYASGISEFRQSLENDSKGTEIALERAKRNHQELFFQIKALGQNPDTILASSILSQDGVYQNLATQLNSLDTSYITNSTNFKKNFPGQENLEAQRQELRDSLKERAEQVLGNSVSKQILDQAIKASRENVVATSEAKISSEISPNSSSRVLVNGNTNNSGANPASDINSQGSLLSDLGNQMLLAKNEIALLQSQIEGTSKAKTKVEANFQNIPELQEKYAELERRLGVKTEAVSYLLNRRQELQIAAAEETAPWKVLDEAYLPNKPFSPNIQRGLALAIAGGGFIGLLTAFLLHKLDVRLKLIDDVKQLTNLPLLGGVPKVLVPRVVLSNESEVGVSKGYSYGYSSFTEAFRSIAMNLTYTVAESDKIKSLVLTSSTSSEGKSTTAYNLGLALTDLEAKVLVVDADMRKPKIHKLAKIENEKGLSDAITSEQPWSELLAPQSVENFDIITAGKNVPNPVALLNSSKMNQLIQEWEEIYDYVIIDTPPIGIMADAQSLIHQVDTVLLVAGLDRATKKSFTHTLEILNNNNCNLAGFIANFVEKDLDYYSYSYYSHYYNQPNRNRKSSEQKISITKE